MFPHSGIWIVIACTISHLNNHLFLIWETEIEGQMKRELICSPSVCNSKSWASLRLEARSPTWVAEFQLPPRVATSRKLNLELELESGSTPRTRYSNQRCRFHNCWAEYPACIWVSYKQEVKLMHSTCVNKSKLLLVWKSYILFYFLMNNKKRL